MGWSFRRTRSGLVAPAPPPQRRRAGERLVPPARRAGWPARECALVARGRAAAPATRAAAESSRSAVRSTAQRVELLHRLDRLSVSCRSPSTCAPRCCRRRLRSLPCPPRGGGTRRKMKGVSPVRDRAHYVAMVAASLWSPATRRPGALGEGANHAVSTQYFDASTMPPGRGRVGVDDGAGWDVDHWSAGGTTGIERRCPGSRKDLMTGTPRSGQGGAHVWSGRRFCGEVPAEIHR